MSFTIPVIETPPLQFPPTPGEAMPQQPAQQPYQQPPVQQPYQQPVQPTQQPYQQPTQQPYQQPVQQPVQAARSPATGVSLKKGQKQSLSSLNPHLDCIDIGLGWDTPTGAQIPYDLDCEAFMLGPDGKIVGDSWFVFYGQPSSPDGSVVHGGDNSTGAGTGDDEVIHVQLSRVDSRVTKIAVVVTIDEAKARNHNFGQISNAYIRIVDKSNGSELCRFSLTEYYSAVFSMVVGELYRHNGEWRFNPVGNGTANDLAGLCAFYGVQVSD